MLTNKSSNPIERRVTMLLSVLAVIALGVGGINAVSDVSDQELLSQVKGEQAIVQTIEPASTVTVPTSDYEF
jgi:acyl CoA:acetate/3-ketoacid CoA transferase